MTPKQFKRFRRAMEWSQKELADRLGVKRRIIQYYESGKRDGEKVTIPRAIELACYALSQNVMRFKYKE